MKTTINTSKLENNQAIIDYKTKTIHFKFNDEVFKCDLSEGDLEDSWNSFTTKDNILRDLNFSLESETNIPSFTVYGLKKESPEDECFVIDSSDMTSFKIIEEIGSKKEYFENKYDKFLEMGLSLNSSDDCPNCGSLKVSRNSSDEIQCDNCGYSENN